MTYYICFTLSKKPLLKGQIHYTKPPHGDRPFCKKIYSFSIKSSWLELVCTRRSTVLLLPISKDSLFYPLGEHEACPEDHLEGDGGQLDPEAAPGHRHDDDDGPATVWHQLRKFASTENETASLICLSSCGRTLEDLSQTNVARQSVRYKFLR